jgi:hypothetical protein
LVLPLQVVLRYKTNVSKIIIQSTYERLIHINHRQLICSTWIFERFYLVRKERTFRR